MTFIVCIACYTKAMLQLSQSLREDFVELIEIGIHLIICSPGRICQFLAKETYSSSMPSV